MKKQHLRFYRNFIANLKATIKHPFFSILAAGIVLIMIQVLSLSGLIPPSIVEVFADLWIYIIVGLGFTLLLGYSGLASLGTAGFIGLGGYLMGYLLSGAGLPVFVVFILGILIAIFVGSLVGFISLRIEGMYLAIITLGLSEILVEIFKFATKFTNGFSGLAIERFTFLGKIMMQKDVYYIIVIVLVFTMFAVVNLVNSPTGRAMLSIKDSSSAAQAMGISVLKYRLLTFVLATVLAVIGGMLYMGYVRAIYPTEWSIGISLNVLAAVVIGGAKSIWGVSLGTIIIFGFERLILDPLNIQWLNNASMIINGLLIIIIVMFYPGGLIRLFKDLSNYFKKWMNWIIKKWRDYHYGEV